MIRKKIIGILFTWVMVALFLLNGCGGQPAETAIGTQSETVVDQLGEGDTSFRLEVVDSDGQTGQWEIRTDAETVGDALYEISFISGETTDFGLMIDTVNGITADWDTDGAFWAFYINGEFATAGADATEIDKDAVYRFVYTEN